MKKIEKKTGRRANRKRRKMEKLARKVAPSAEPSHRVRPSLDSKSAQPSQVRSASPDCAAPVSSTSANNLPARVSPKAEAPTAASLTPGMSEAEASHSSSSAAGCNGSGLQQVRSDSSRSSIRRRRRMKRIREELKRQQAVGVAEPTVTATTKSQNAPIENSPVENGSVENSPVESMTADAADVVRKMAAAPDKDSNPTAQSMVAMAGAVTALASAIQLRLTDPAESKTSDADVAAHGAAESSGSENTAASGNQPTASTTSATTTAASAAPVAATSAAGIAIQEESVPAERSPSVLDRHSVSDSEPSEQPEQPEQPDSARGFDDSFFGDDESDVAGAYTVLPPAAEPEESYGDWFRRVVVRNKWITWFTAFYVHWLILLLMMVVFVHGPEQTANLLLNGAFADSLPEETEAFEMSVTEPLPQMNEPEAAATAAEPVAEAATLSEMAEESLELNDALLQNFSQQNSEGESDTATASDSDAEPVTKSLATPAHSVSQGSFSVWTEPEYPSAGEPYRIIVQIQLPPNTKDYHVRDLNGVVVGSDGYRKTFPGLNHKPLQIVDGCVRLVVPIVSADERVKDTIFIRSQLLRETQKLLLEF